MQPPNETFTFETLQVEPVGPGELRLSGTLASERVRTALRQYLEKVHVQIVAAGITSFKIDVLALDFVDSSALRLFIDWTSRATRARYRLVFLTNRNITWHRISFAALRSLAPAWVTVVEKTASPGEPPR